MLMHIVLFNAIDTTLWWTPEWVDAHNLGAGQPQTDEALRLMASVGVYAGPNGPGVEASHSFNGLFEFNYGLDETISRKVVMVMMIGR